MAGQGLEEIVAARTSLSHVYGDEGRLIYRGYDIQDLAEQVTFEETCHLLWFGELPNQEQLADLQQQLSAGSSVPMDVFDALRPTSGQAHPMTQFLAGLGLLAARDPDTRSMQPDANLRKSIRLTGQALTLTAGISRLMAGQEPVLPRNDLPLA